MGGSVALVKLGRYTFGMTQGSVNRDMILSHTRELGSENVLKLLSESDKMRSYDALRALPEPHEGRVWLAGRLPTA